MKKATGKIVLLVKLTGRWSRERYAAKDARAKAGWTSVRIDKATFAKLHAMTCELPKYGEEKSHREFVTPYAMTELLHILANAQAVPLETMHACPDPRVHADAGKLVEEMKAKVARYVGDDLLYTDGERRVLADFWDWLVPEILALRVMLRRRPKVHASPAGSVAIAESNGERQERGDA